MKDPISIHNNHQERIDEIFGKIARFFSSTPTQSSGIKGTYRKKGEEIPVGISSKEAEKFHQKADTEFAIKAKAYKDKMLDPSFCDPAYTEKLSKGKKSKIQNNQKERRISYLPDGGIIINGQNEIHDFSELFIENTIRGEGNGSFRKMLVKDFVCYNDVVDLYGIAWLFNKNASYEANKISGKLYANKYNQSVNFNGEWYYGDFYGRMIGKKIILPSSKTSSKPIVDELNKLEKLIDEVKNNFNYNFGDLEIDEIKNKVYSSDNQKIKNLYPEFAKIYKYITSSISNEIPRLKSMIDQNKDQDQIKDEIDDLYKKFKQIDYKINNFWNEYNNLSLPKSQPKQVKKIKV